MRQNITIKALTGVSLIVILVGLIAAPLRGDDLIDTPIRFAVIGDRTGSHVPGIYAEIISEVVRLRPDFVTTPGDMIEGYTDDTVAIIREWKEYDSLIAPLAMAFYKAPGNHDILSDIQERMYRRIVGEPYYSADYKNIHLVMLDAGRWESSEELPEEQINWLIDDLKRNQDAAYTFVFLHKPFWYNSVAEGEPDTLHSLFVNFGVHAVFTGHFHQYFSGTYDGIIYTNVGSSGGGADPSPTGLLYHFLWVTVDGEGIHIAPIKKGAVLSWDHITVKDLKTYTPIQQRGITFKSPVITTDDLKVNDVITSVTLDNTYSDFALDDTIRLTVPEGWTVSPEAMPVSVPPAESRTYDLSVTSTGRLFPVPSAAVDFNYAEDKEVTAESNLRVARQASCYPVTMKPKIDGNIKEDFWHDPESVLFEEDGGDMNVDPVKFYFAYDKDNLYLAARCEDMKMDSLVAEANEHDGAVYREDCVGYFIEPSLGSDTLYQIYFNPLGTVYDAKYWIADEGYLDGSRDWNGSYEVKSKKGDSFWSIEMRIPLEQFGVTMEEGQKMRLNFRRKHTRFNSAADWQVPLEYDASTYGFLIMK